MRDNEEEITGVSDKSKLPIEKRPIADIKADTKPPSLNYHPLKYADRPPQPLLTDINPITLYDFFCLYIPAWL